mmetsp:Transcript_14559/g.21531  ORF Transcript_14559/g.21531 Transcript_14559/m.21531 type:complete len:119 (+) Transcript_14559:181-537(+)
MHLMCCGLKVTNSIRDRSWSDMNQSIKHHYHFRFCMDNVISNSGSSSALFIMLIFFVSTQVNSLSISSKNVGKAFRFSTDSMSIAFVSRSPDKKYFMVDINGLTSSSQLTRSEPMSKS